MRTPLKVLRALRHVRKYHPEVTGVVFNVSGRWYYFDDVFSSIVFSKKVDTGILEDAADAVCDKVGFPAVFEPYRSPR